MKKVACVGILVADVMAPIGTMPGKGELARVDSVTVHNGGNAMTAAINLHKMGVESKMIGKVGDTGNSQGAHLHFEIRYYGEKKDPMNYVKNPNK